MRPFFHGAAPSEPTMPHMAYHHYYRGGRRGPIRAVWFIIGAMSAAAWMKHKENKKAIANPGADGGYWNGHGGSGQGWQHGFGHGHGKQCGSTMDRREVEERPKADYGAPSQLQRPIESDGHVAAPMSVPVYEAPVAPAVGMVAPPQNRSQAVPPQVDNSWTEEREKVREIGRQASETVRSLPFTCLWCGEYLTCGVYVTDVRVV